MSEAPLSSDQHPYFCQTHGLTRNGECSLCKRDAQASKERVAFEKWADEQGYELGRRAVPYTSGTNQDGDYSSPTTQVSWLAWEARAAGEPQDCPCGAFEFEGQMLHAPSCNRAAPETGATHNEVRRICTAYEQGFGDGIDQRNKPNPYGVTSSEAQAFDYGYESGSKRREVKTSAVPNGDWLWGKFMDWCRKRRVNPADYNDLFAIVADARSAPDVDGDRNG